jgi:hypothetical protein
MLPCQLCLRKRDLRTIGAAGNIIIDMGVLLSEDVNRSTQRNSAERWAAGKPASLYRRRTGIDLCKSGAGRGSKPPRRFPCLRTRARRKVVHKPCAQAAIQDHMSLVRLNRV